MKINVLLTGAGGNLGHFIQRALEASSLDFNLIACDYSHDAVGLYLVDHAYVVPPARDAGYLDRIIEICQQESIHVILAGGMVEMRLLARHREQIRATTGATVITSSPESLERMEDKWNLVQHLASHGFDHPRSVLPADVASYQAFLDQVPYPYIVKDRLGGGSKGLGVASHKRQLDYLIETIPNAVIQEYLQPDDEEYTVGVFLSQSSQAKASIVMKRQLGLGMTFKAQVLADSDLATYCERVAETFTATGPINLQLRLTTRGPVLFEINPRFSSTTSARPHFGYNEVEMSLRHFVLGEEIRRPLIKPGRFYRVIEDVVVDERQFDALRTQGSRIKNRP
jgi:carbamoyl-phosphate synthase large subunit